MGYKDLKFPEGSLFLVTGGAGFIGSNLCEAILKLGYRVRCLDDLSTGKQTNVDLFIDRIKELKEIKQKQEYELKTVCPLNEEILKQVLCLFFEKISIMDLMQPEMKKEIVKLFIDKIYVTNTSMKILFKQSNKTGESSLVMDLVKNTSGLAHQIAHY